MALEIERKFLVDTSLWRPKGAGVLYRQGYISADKDRVVRVRLAGAEAYLTLKGRTEGVSRREFEYAIPVADASEMLDHLCLTPLIEKVRHRETWNGLVWEIDVFQGDNQGLVVAEVELSDENPVLTPPPWAGPEVSNDPRYFNSSLVGRPYSTWSR